MTKSIYLMGYYWDIINIELSFIFVHFSTLAILWAIMNKNNLSLFLILATAFLDILGMSLFIPLLPSIISGFWVDPSWTGYTQAVYAIGMFAWWLIFGGLSDKYGRKRMLVFTSLINLLSYAIMLVSIWSLTINTMPSMIWSESPLIGIEHFLHAFSGWTPMFVLFLLARLVGGFGGAGFSVIQAYISDISTPVTRMKNMWLMGAAFGIAFLVWPALSGVLSHWISPVAIIGITFFVVFLNVILINVLLREPPKHVHTEEVHLVDFHFSRVVLILFVLSFGATLAFSAIQAMSTQFYADRFAFSATQIGYTMAMVWLVAVLYQAWLVRYVRAYFDEYQMVRVAFLILIVWFVWFSLNQSPVWLFFWVIFFPLGMWSFNPSVWALLAKNAWKEVWKVMGYNTSIQSIWQIVWPILAWLLYVTPGTNAPFIASAVIFVVLFAISLTLRK